MATKGLPINERDLARLRAGSTIWVEVFDLEGQMMFNTEVRVSHRFKNEETGIEQITVIPPDSFHEIHIAFTEENEGLAYTIDSEGRRVGDAKLFYVGSYVD